MKKINIVLTDAGTILGKIIKFKTRKKYTNVLVVPEVSSYEQQGKINLYKVVNDTAISNVIEVIDRVDNMIIVKDGVKEGDVIVVSGIGSLRNKTAIQPKKANFDTIVSSIKPVFK